MRTASGVACQRRILKWDLDRDSGISMVHRWMKDLSSRISVRLPNGKRNKGSGRSSRANLRARERSGTEASRVLSESTPTRFERQSDCFPTLNHLPNRFRCSSEPRNKTARSPAADLGDSILIHDFLERLR